MKLLPLILCLLSFRFAGGGTTKPVLPPAPAGVTVQQDVAYLDPSRTEKLDLYLPSTRPADAHSPAIVLIHGGGWTGGDKAAPREFNIGTNLAKAGYVVASVNYQLAKPRWPQNLLDCKNAVRFLRASADKYQIDPDNIGVIGGSAGGHLALMVAYTTGIADLEPASPYPNISSGVKAVVDLYGITDVLTRRKIAPDGTPVGDPIKTSALLDSTGAEAWKHASPVYHVSSATPPTLIVHGTADTTVDRDQATELAAALEQHNVDHRLITFDKIGHTFDLQTWNHKPLPQDLRPIVIGFFDQYLKAAAPPSRSSLQSENPQH